MRIALIYIFATIAFLGVGQSVAQDAGWQKDCAEELCVVRRELTLPDAQKLVVAVVNNGQSAPWLSVGMPLDIDPSSPVGWLIPAIEDSSFGGGKRECGESYCSFIGALGEAGVVAMKRGNLVRLSYRTKQGPKRSFELSLKGFTAAYDGPPADSVESPSGAEIEVQPEAPAEQAVAMAGTVNIPTPLWVKRCDSGTGECLVETKLETESGTASLGVSVAGGGKEPSVRVILPHLVNVGTVHWVIPGVVDTGYKPEPECFFSMSRCEFMAALGPTGVAEMKQGDAVILHWTDQSGTERRYRFSLDGFTAAYDSEGEVVDAVSIRIEKQAELNAFLVEQAEETRRRAAAGEGEALRAENEEQLKELGLSEGTADPVQSSEQPSTKEQELAAALETVRKLEAEITAGAAAAAMPTTQNWTKICPDAACLVQAWTVDSDKRYIIVAAMPDEQKMRVSFLARSEEVEAALVWSVGDGAPTEVAATCSKRGCTADLGLTGISSAIAAAPADSQLKFGYQSVKGEAVIGAFPTSGYIAALVSAPIKGGAEAAYMENMLAEVRAFAGLPEASSEQVQTPPDRPTESPVTQEWTKHCTPGSKGGIGYELCTVHNWTVASNGKVVQADFVFVAASGYSEADMHVVFPPGTLAKGGVTTFADESKRFNFLINDCDAAEVCRAEFRYPNFPLTEDDFLFFEFFDGAGQTVQAKIRVGRLFDALDGPSVSDEEFKAFTETVAAEIARSSIPVAAAADIDGGKANSAPEQPVSGTSYGWMKSCGETASTAEDCSTMRRVLTDEGKPLWVAIFTHPGGNDRIEFWVPRDASPGVGAWYYVDEGDPSGGTAFDNCADYCITSIEFTPKLRSQLERGAVLKVSHNTATGRTVDTPVDLAGITKALAGAPATPAEMSAYSVQLSAEDYAFKVGPAWKSDCRDDLSEACTIAAERQVGLHNTAKVSVGISAEGNVSAALNLPATTEYGDEGKWRVDDGRSLEFKFAKCSDAGCTAVLPIGLGGLKALGDGSMLTIEFTDRELLRNAVASIGLANFPTVSLANLAETPPQDWVSSCTEDRICVSQAQKPIAGDDQVILQIDHGPDQNSATVDVPLDYLGTLSWIVDGKKMSFGMKQGSDDFSRASSSFDLYPADIKRLQEGKVLTIRIFSKSSGEPREVSFDLDAFRESYSGG